MEIDFLANELRERDPELAGLFEDEVRAALASTTGRAACRLLVEAMGDALERVNLVLLQGDRVTEWAVTLPVAPGDVRRASLSAIADRRQGGDRRSRSRPMRGRRS
jgi:hypothetical protein